MANLSIVIVPAKKLSNGRHRVRIAVAHRSQTRYISALTYKRTLKIKSIVDYN